METKQDIRKRILAKRSGMSEKEWFEKSRIICEKIISHPLFRQAEDVYCYVDYNHEADTHQILKKAWAAGKKIAVPRVEGNDMEFYYLRSFDELSPGYFGIPEPVTDYPACGKEALVIMPGVVFDRNRHRIGYGKGFYDRYLKSHSEYRTIAVAFDFQVEKTIPSEAHDICPEVLITEENLYV